jgi:hypothetical protein
LFRDFADATTQGLAFKRISNWLAKIQAQSKRVIKRCQYRIDWPKLGRLRVESGAGPFRQDILDGIWQVGF